MSNLFAWGRRLLGRPGGLPARPGKRYSSFRPRIEALEERVVLNSPADLLPFQQGALPVNLTALSGGTLEDTASPPADRAGIGDQGASQVPRHLADALALVRDLDLEHTGYEHGVGTITWEGTPEAYVDCSQFINDLLQHSYGYDTAQFQEWFGSGRPTAAQYHDAIVNQHGFTQVSGLGDVRPGDLLAVKYADPKEKSTGHILLVAGPARQVEPGRPLAEGTLEWEVPVIDSARSGHGPTDTRHGKGEDGRDHDGVGQGVLAVYTDQNGSVVGYSWSTSPQSALLGQDDHDLVIGRLSPGSLSPNDPAGPEGTPSGPAADVGGEIQEAGAASFPITEQGEALGALLDQLDVEHHWLPNTKLADADGNPVLDADGNEVPTSVTHCDAFVKRACDLLGAPMITGEGSRDHANQQYDWLVDQALGQTDPSAAGWHVVTALEAQGLANLGGVVVAACRNTAGKPGHVALVRPSDKDSAAILDEGPQIIQAGKVNYNSTSVAEGFSVHPGAWGGTEGPNTPVSFFYYLPAS
jgi:hypothetical protein